MKKVKIVFNAPITYILIALISLGQEIWQGIMVNDNISNMAHIIGGIVGALSGYGLNVKRRR